MNYLKLYIKLVRKAQGRVLPEDVYREKHHIFPASIFGDNKVLVELTYKEHLVAHHLLYKAYLKRYGEKDSRTNKAKFAFVCMINYVDRKRLMSEQKIIFKLVKALGRKNRLGGEFHPMWGRTHSEEAKEKQRGVRNKNEYNWKNLHTGEILINKTCYYLRHKYEGLSATGVYRLANKELISYKGWVLLDDNLNRVRDDAKIPDYSINKPVYNWKNRKTGAIEWNKKAIEMRKKYNLTYNDTSALINLTTPTTKNWFLIDENENSLYQSQVVSKRTSKRKEKCNWRNINTGEIILGLATTELATLKGLNKSCLYVIKELKRKHHRGWEVIDSDGNSLYTKRDGRRNPKNNFYEAAK